MISFVTAYSTEYGPLAMVATKSSMSCTPAMPRVDGLTAAATLDGAPAVVFVTAYDQHAVRAFELGADDYLLKPHEPARVAAAVARVRDRLASRAPRPALPQRFLAASGQRLVVVRAADIESVSAADNYVEIVTRTGRALLHRTLAALEQELDPHTFVRIHRSHLVRAAAITAVEPLASGDAVVVLRSGARLPMSRTHRAAVVERLGRV